MDYQLYLGIITLIVVIAIPVLTSIRKRWFKRPKVIIQWERGSYIISPKDNKYFINTSVKLTFSNNSSTTAYNIEVIDCNNEEFKVALSRLNIIPKITEAGNDKIFLTHLFNRKYNADNKEDANNEFSKELSAIKVILKYENEYGTNFYTLYSYRDNNSFRWFKPKIKQIKGAK